MFAGDIAAIPKLSDARTGDTLSTKAVPIRFGKKEISTPYTCKRYKVPNKNDIDKVSQTLQRMAMEDQTLRVENDSANRQMLL